MPRRSASRHLCWNYGYLASTSDLTQIELFHTIVACACSQSLKLSELSKNNAELEQTRDDVIAEMESHHKREAESLEFTERITMMNSHLQSENLHLMAEVMN